MAAVVPQPDYILNRYRVLERIGAGAMGVVYRAHDERLKRDVAVKVLAEGLLADTSGRQRFRHEAFALSRLNHPNIEIVYDFDTQEGVDYLIIELIPGTALNEMLRQGPLPEPQVVGFGIQLANGLTAAHKNGVIHRDLKPGNLRVTPDGHLKILDFGLAKLAQPPAAHSESATEEQTRGAAGTLPYMAPEQLRDEPLDGRTDIYAAGVVLYELATGRRPFDGNQALLIDAILNQQPQPPRNLNPRISLALEAVILAAMAKDRAQRFPTAEQLRLALERLDQSDVKTETRLRLPVTRISRRMKSVFAAFAVIVLAVSGWVWRHRPAYIPEQKYIAVLPFRSTSGTGEDQAFSRGLTETIGTKLTRLTAAHPLQVAAPAEVERLHVATLDDARKELGVNMVIDGSLQRDGGRMRVNVSLVDADSRKLLRAETVTAAGADLFALEDEVVQTAVSMLELELRANEKQALSEHGTLNKQAFDLYTKGRGYLQESDLPESVDTAIASLKQAVSLDEGYAAAYAALGEAYWNKYQDSKDRGLIEQARQACQRSLRLEPRLADGHVCLGKLEDGAGHYEVAASEFQLALNADATNDGGYRGLASAYEKLGRIENAEETYKKAIRARPNYFNGYSWLGSLYFRRARYAEALQQFIKARELAPSNANVWSNIGAVYLEMGQPEDAIRALQRSNELRPSFEGYSNLGQTYFTLRRFGEAIAAFEQAVALNPNQVQAFGNLARAYYWNPPTRGRARETFLRAIALAENDLRVNPKDADALTLEAQYRAMVGDRAGAAQHMQDALKLRPHDPETAFFAGIVYNQLGDHDLALSWLAKAVEYGYSPAELSSTIELDSLRTDPRFKALLPKKDPS